MHDAREISKYSLSLAEGGERGGCYSLQGIVGGALALRGRERGCVAMLLKVVPTRERVYVYI